MGRAARLALGVLFAVGAARAACYLAYACFQIGTPFEAFHLEAKMVLLAWRAQDGDLLYPAWRDYPHVANFFGPVYFAATGLLGRACGADLRGLFLIGRAVTFASGLATSVLLGAVLARRFGRRAGIAGAVLSLGAPPMIVFSVMARPDMLAELLGLGGFFLSGRRSLGAGLAGAALLVLAILTKQTAALFLLAAASALWLEGARRRAIALLGGGPGALALIVALVTLLGEPNFARDLVGESRTPWDVSGWLTVLRRLATGAPDLCYFAAVGLALWTARTPRDPRLAALAAVLLAVSLATSAKHGADLNYFLSLRAVEALAVGTLWHAVDVPASRSGRASLAVAAVFGAVSLLPSTVSAGTDALGAWRLSDGLAGPTGRAVVHSYERLFRMAEDPQVHLLTDSGLIDLHHKGRADFGDPWLFRLLAETGQVRPDAIRRAIESEDYDLVVTTSDLAGPGYERYEFGLPTALIASLRAHYAPAGSEAGLFLYRRRGRVDRRRGERL